MSLLRPGYDPRLAVLTCVWAVIGCGGTESPGTATGGAAGVGGAGGTGAQGGGGGAGTAGGAPAVGGAAGKGGSAGGTLSAGGMGAFGGSSGGSTAGGSGNAGGTSGAGAGGNAMSGGVSGVGPGGRASGGAGAGGLGAVGGAGGRAATGGGPAGGAGAGGSGGASSDYPCDGTTAGYDTVMTQSGGTWSVMHGGTSAYSGSDMQAALTAAYGSLTSNRTMKESILVQGSGDVPASAQLSIPSYTILNVCGTLNVSGTPSGSDRSPLYARGKRDIEIPNLKMTGSPQYGLFFRETNNVHLGQIDLRLTASAGIGIRVDSGPNAGSQTTFNTNLRIDYVYGSGMGSHIVETYGIDGIQIGTVEGDDVGECGLLLNRSINAEVGLVDCTDCATGTGYAAFRVANSVGKIGSEFPAGNVHVGNVIARGGGRGIFSVSGCGGLTIDQIDIADTGNTSILLQNTYNTTIAAVSGTVDGGIVQLTNDTDNTNDGTYPPSENVTLQNLVLSGGAQVRQDWCSEFGSNGCSAVNITGGTVSMCD
jgi:hypothetical protein